MSKSCRKIRIGQINYTNVWPIFHHFPKHKFSHKVEWISQVPAKLNSAMQRGDVDMGPISSFAFGQANDRYILLPDLSVSAFGQVNSILLFHKQPLEQLRNATIALPTTSATSVHLLKIILQQFYDASPDYFYAAPNLDKMLQHADAALLIGDDAIKTKWRTSNLRVTDLGELWRHWTGCWMTFAVWAIRKETAQGQPKAVQKILAAFLETKRQGLNHLHEIVQEAIRVVGGTETYWHHYFTTLNYDFGAEQQAGLKLYYRYARQFGYIKKPVAMELLSKQNVN